MAYVRENWTSETLITSQRMNNIEEGIENNDKNTAELKNKLGKAGGIAQLGEDGKILKDQMQKPAFESYEIMKTDECSTKYSASRIIVQTGVTEVVIDMTIAALLTAGKHVTIGTFDTSIAPAKNINKNTTTNKGASCYVSVTTEGKIDITAISDLEEKDGIRENIVYFAGH